MAQVIQYYVPENFKKKVKWVPKQERGRLIDFPIAPEKKSA